MGRKAALTEDQVKVIRESDRILKDLARIYEVSILTIWKAKWGKPPYNYGGVYDSVDTNGPFENVEVA